MEDSHYELLAYREGGRTADEGAPRGYADRAHTLGVNLTVFVDIGAEHVGGIWRQVLDVFRGAILADW